LQVQWVPDVGKNRIKSFVDGRGDWCISRQRSWGVPIPVFYDVATGKDFLLNEETLDHIQKLFANHGSDCWWTMGEAELLPKKYRDEAAKWKKGTDTMDVWFDSGSSWAGVAQRRDELSYPADIYLEGSDQHRGWFQSSLLTSVASNKLAPYKTVLTHGFVLDEKGFKMSKSLGNVVDPMKVVNGGSNKKTEPAYGADVLRLWVANSDYSGDVGIGDNIIKQTFENYRKLRNTARYLIGNLADFVPEGHYGSNAVAYQDLPSLDKWMLGQLSYVLRTVDEAIDQYQFQKAVQEIMRFASADLSNFYLDVAKDRLYISAIDDMRRRSCQTVIHACLEGFAKAISPLLPHMAEDIWQNLPYEKATNSVFEGGWPSRLMNFPPTDTRDWELVLKLRDDVNKMLEVARADKVLGASLEAAAYIYFENSDEREILSKLIGDVDLVSPPVKTNGVDELRTVLMLSEVHLVDSESDIRKMCDAKYVSSGPTFSGCIIGIKKASGQKCARCWFYDNSVGKHSLPHSDACQRCNDAVVSWEKHFGNPFVRPLAETEPAIEPVI
jgi:isoleucyl-tRNA synthetase